MTLLILGLALFLIPHLAGLVPPLKAGLTGALGRGGHKGAHALMSLAGLALMIIGYQQADVTPVYDPLDSRALAHALMPFAFILVAGANMKSNLKRYIRHPMSLGVMLWSISHLSANGDLASVLLFGGIGLFALLDFVVSTPAPPPPLRPRSKDLILVAAGLVAYGAALWAHGAVFGVYVVG